MPFSLQLQCGGSVFVMKLNYKISLALLCFALDRDIEDAPVSYVIKEFEDEANRVASEGISGSYLAFVPTDYSDVRDGIIVPAEGVDPTEWFAEYVLILYDYNNWTRGAQCACKHNVRVDRMVRGLAAAI